MQGTAVRFVRSTMNTCRFAIRPPCSTALSADSANVIVANEQQGGIPDPYELGMVGYRNCLALLDDVMPDVAQRIRGT